MSDAGSYDSQMRRRLPTTSTDRIAKNLYGHAARPWAPPTRRAAELEFYVAEKGESIEAESRLRAVNGPTPRRFRMSAKVGIVG